MKKIKILGFIAVMVLLFGSCSTKTEDPAGQRDVAVVPEISNFFPAVFDYNHLDSTYVQFDLNITGMPAVSQAIIQVSYNGGLQRVEFTTLNSFPVTMQIKLTDVVAKLGMVMDSIHKGDVFTIEVAE